VLQNVCETALTVKCSYYTQKEACNAFMKLIELFKNDLNFINTVNKFINLICQNTNSIKGENTLT